MKSRKEMGEEVLSSETVYRGRSMHVRRDEVMLPTGRKTSREIIEHPGSVAIIPILGDGRIVLIRQFRLAAGGIIWEVPAGTMERGEAPRDCALRELREETGFRAGRMEFLFSCFLAPGYSMERMHFFRASELEEGSQRTEEDEAISVEPVGAEEAMRMIADGTIVDAKTIASVAYLRAQAATHA